MIALFNKGADQIANDTQLQTWPTRKHDKQTLENFQQRQGKGQEAFQPRCRIASHRIAYDTYMFPCLPVTRAADSASRREYTNNARL